MNDLWTFDVESKSWSWIGGAQHPVVSATYGDHPGVLSETSYPGAKTDPILWVDTENNYFYIFGGGGYGNDSAGNEHSYHCLLMK